MSEPPRLPVLHRVVEQLARLAPRTDVDDILEHFDELWRSADSAPFRSGSEIVDDARRPSADPVDRSGAADASSPDVEELGPAMGEGQLFLVYLPILDRDGAVTAVEAFIRWRHRRLGVIRANEILAVADRAGLLRELNLWVLRAGTAEAVRWTGRYRPGVTLNIDRVLLGPDFVATVIEAMERSGLSWDRLVIELTEESFRWMSQAAQSAVYELVGRGVRVTLDDFGTGYSSLSRLKRIPAHTLNIAREFVADVVGDPVALSVVRSVCDLGHSMGRRVMAEGVETAQQLQVLRELGVDAFQGYLFGRPLPPEEVRELLAVDSFPPLDEYL